MTPREDTTSTTEPEAARAASVLTDMADELHQRAHHNYGGPHPSPDQYAAADTALRGIGLSLNQITAAAWHLAILDTDSRLRHQATHETARSES